MSVRREAQREYDRATVRYNIRRDSEEHQLIIREATRLRVPESVVVRVAVRDYFDARQARIDRQPTLEQIAAGEGRGRDPRGRW